MPIRSATARARLLGIVHRDIGTKNVLIGYEGDVKLTDFGIAKALDLMYNEEGKVIAGKDEYLSPEQASYAVTDARADLFPLGIVLTELLLGKKTSSARPTGPDVAVHDPEQAALAVALLMGIAEAARDARDDEGRDVDRHGPAQGPVALEELLEVHAADNSITMKYWPPTWPRW